MEVKWTKKALCNELQVNWLNNKYTFEIKTNKTKKNKKFSANKPSNVVSSSNTFDLIFLIIYITQCILCSLYVRVMNTFLSDQLYN